MIFREEGVLVDRFIDCLLEETTPWGSSAFVREFDFRRGRPDVVIVPKGSDHVVAVEAKLRRWRDALYQASRNRCFAHRSYVLLPKAVAKRAEEFVAEFEWHNVGLCYLEDGAVHILHEPTETHPVEPWLSAAAMNAVRETINRP